MDEDTVSVHPHKESRVTRFITSIFWNWRGTNELGKGQSFILGPEEARDIQQGVMHISLVR